ncbi:DEAD/DEAH box helicase [Limosilactobacillus fastidiosus]|uniref:DEAD/DEAH box helicase n=1 Tax=Limosilactobacillus fastidiosus TaxID=2759855 RepID=A0ABR6E7G2_9LACO|nr:DEAD/DEAH box helicase [Limosilactobacillus fastidiosus]MBB1063134.1 DEAD/DEAH box helicase [Limosilactobacillus fastidiosus]MCD7084118.1 DEAD/DEAH box helicase [Limosilactobacillus fastidiosus]
MTEKKTIKNAILNGLYDRQYQGHQLLTPQLVGNFDGTIWETLRSELTTCKSFTWVIAFITTDMITPLKVVMADLAFRGIKGTLITSDYLGFNSPQMFRELLKIPNLKVRLADVAGFHTKGYYFTHEDYMTALIGSANFTRAALLKNYETMLKLTSTRNATLFSQITDEIQRLRHQSEPLTAKWVTEYAEDWQPPKTRIRVKNTQKIVPNKMQKAALKELQSLITRGAGKGLVISATGTGKTYLGAFAVKKACPQKFLYVVHREQIARKTMESFRRVIGGPKSDFGLISGDHHDFVPRYLFATVQTLAQKKLLQTLSPKMFDYILIDEAHRVAAPSYRRLMNHFQPVFWLGMTATPDRMDNQDVYGMFDYHIAYEIRLKDALNNQMLVPFHYVGVEDYEIDGKVISETTKLNRLVASERVKYVLTQLDYYGYCGSQPRGLVFCSRQEEARELAREFTASGHYAVALTNQDSNQRRQKAVQRLENGELEYIITVDLFNEGVDIPSLNQIVMLRNTQSKIVFLQQLGRGLRKYPGKDFVTVIDFIGNYKHNYMIPLALNDDTSCDRDQVRREVQLPQNIGVSTINFSRIASDRVLASIERTKLDSMVELRRGYHELQQRLGRRPLLLDFFRYGSISPIVFAQNNLLTNYGTFLCKLGEKVTLTQYEDQVLSFITKELLNGKRAHELILLSILQEHQEITEEQVVKVFQQNGCYVNRELLQSVMKILSLQFFDVKAGKKMKKHQYGDQPLVIFADEKYRLNPQIIEALKQNLDFYSLYTDAIKTGLALSKNYDQGHQLTLYEQYDRKDVCRLLNWPLDVSAPMYGYRIAKNECPIFITYQKQSAKQRNALYNNQLQDGQSLRWYTRSPRHLSSSEVQRLLAGVDAGKPKVKLHLFVKRSDAVGKQFYYLGTAKIDPKSVKEELLGEKKKATVGMNLILEHPLSNIMNEMLFKE